MMARLLPFLVLLLIASLATPALGRSATDAYGDALDAMHGSRAATKAAADDSADQAAEMKALIAYATQQLNLAKAELRQLEAAYRLAMRELKSDAHECERERLAGIYAAERSRLKARIRDYRHIRGDRRGFFTRAWHAIGPAGRRIARAFGDNALDIAASGGTLGGGVARRLLIRAGRDELKGAALRAVARSVHGCSAVAVAAASSACGDDENDAVDEGAPAIAAGTYVGEWPMDLAPDPLVTGKVAETNFVELQVDEDGAISGEGRYRLTGLFDGCSGYLEDWGFVVDADERVGPELPQAIGVFHDGRIVVPVVDLDLSDVSYVCGDPAEPFLDDAGSIEAEIDITDDGVVTLMFGDDGFELQWVP